MLTREGKREDSIRERSLDSSSSLQLIAIEIGLRQMEWLNIPHPHNSLVVDVVEVGNTTGIPSKDHSLSGGGDCDRSVQMKRTCSLDLFDDGNSNSIPRGADSAAAQPMSYCGPETRF